MNDTGIDNKRIVVTVVKYGCELSRKGFSFATSLYNESLQRKQESKI